MSYEINPKNFNPLFNVAGCVIEAQGKIILLQRKNSSIQGNKWGIPSGKIENKEDPLSAIQREIEEETGIKINKDKIKLIKKYKARHSPGYDFIYNLFYTKIKKINKLKLDEDENINSILISPIEALNMPLVEGTNECIKNLYNLNKI